MNSSPCTTISSSSSGMENGTFNFSPMEASPETIEDYDSPNSEKQSLIALMGAHLNGFQQLPMLDDEQKQRAIQLQNLLFLANSQLFNKNYEDNLDNEMSGSEDSMGSYARLLADIDAEISRGQKLSPSENENFHVSKHQQKCTICRIEDATVFHFGVDVCTGCRAFFRRSVAQQKTYRCLNSRLCGNNTCMLLLCEAALQSYFSSTKSQEEQLQMQRMDMNGNVMVVNGDTSLNQLAMPLNPTVFVPNREYSTSANPSNNIVEQFVLFRRRITYERLQSHYKEPQASRPRGMMHHIALGLKEFDLMSKVLDRMQPYDSFSAGDREILWAEYSVCWTVSENCWATIRNGGHYTKRCYHVDGSYVQLDDEGARRHWRSLNYLLPEENRYATFEALLHILLAIGISFNSNLFPEIAKASLSEEEVSALLLLVFTRHEVIGTVSESAAKALSDLRQKSLSNLAQHINSSGRDVGERMGQIIFLISSFQDHVHLLKQTIKLIRAATSPSTQAFPTEYINLLDSAEKRMRKLSIDA
ncbi:zinc finger, c4 type (two domains) domain-containing protein [Ditylenchus destructor]|uniref:Zinc finger, c4 type (Two domains) domain-containing protein n=1 Tax=Ditylenchus destructor TaxID=166010 RepID=A0AAD4MY18_9BILA|nr:zinc finger, c4 type (two domains) domain-containing protein [Ditylenchus destructor]